MNLLVICYNFRHTFVFYSDFFSPHREIRFRKMCLPDFNPHERSWQQRCGLLLSVLWQLVCTCVYLCIPVCAYRCGDAGARRRGGRWRQRCGLLLSLLWQLVLTCAYLYVPVCAYRCGDAGARRRGGRWQQRCGFLLSLLWQLVCTCAYLCAHAGAATWW